jgi:F-type H+-transporting ATPase subunit delta
MSALRIANRYAQSLLQLSIETGQLEQVMQDISQLRTSIEENREFLLMLRSPIINSDRKMHVLNAVFKGRLSTITQNFLEILVRKGREKFLPEVVFVFREKYNEYKGITPVVLSTPYPLSDDIKQNIISKLKEHQQLKTVELVEVIDESLIGGYVLHFDGKMIDTSISRGLAILKDDFDNNDYIRKF